MTKNNPEFLDRIEKVRRALLKLGSCVPTNGYQRICETNKYQPNSLWDMVKILLIKFADILLPFLDYKKV